LTNSTTKPDDLDSEVDLLCDLFNWPADGSIGSTVRLIYHIILDDKRKISKIEYSGDRTVIYFADSEWPGSLTLAPKRRQ
jgi:hypothetical protein